ncbi:hypothetical protein [Frankia sp. Allo2]|nr:hypothetical protein [Frankia sp. Allo2]
MRHTRGMLVGFVVFAVALRVVWWSIAPILPTALIVIVVLTVFALLFSRFLG